MKRLYMCPASAAGLSMMLVTLAGCAHSTGPGTSRAGVVINEVPLHFQNGCVADPQIVPGLSYRAGQDRLAAALGDCRDKYGDLLDHANSTVRRFNTQKAPPAEKRTGPARLFGAGV